MSLKKHMDQRPQMIVLIELMLRFCTGLTKRSIATSVAAMSFMLMRYRFDNVQHRDSSPDKLHHKVHGWAALGWNSKTSKIIWYTISRITNGAITKAFVE